MRRFATLFPLPLLFLILLCAGCAGVGTLRPDADTSGEMTIAPDSKVQTDASGDITLIPRGVTMLYSQKPDAVFQAALTALPQVGLTVVETDPNRRYVLAERGLNLMSNGENVGVYLTPHQAGTQVTVTSRRKTATNVLAKDFAMPVHLQIGALLGGQAKQP